MQKSTTLFQGLLGLSLLTLICSAHAQDSVSSYEQSLDNKSGSGNQTQSAADPSEIPANYDMEALSKALKERGWSIKHKADGSLILNPQQSSENTSDSKSSKNDQWQQLQQEFQKAGWSAELDADGAMILTPSEKAPATKPEVVSLTVQDDEKLSFKDMQTKLKESGWDVSTNSDGSVLLYPPEQAAAKKIRPCPGVKPSVEVALPVDSWQEAHDIAQGWLNSESIADSAVGKIRKILNVYIISIVSDKAPFALMHQIAINNSDGSIIVLN